MGEPKSVLRFWKIGSDPEFVLVDNRDWRQRLYSAQDVLIQDRHAGLVSVIGLDGHASTAELRPAPAHNVRYHMWQIGQALLATRDHLQKKPQTAHLLPCASPVILGERLGGHIHTSFFMNAPHASLGKLLEDYILRDNGELQPVVNRAVQLSNALLSTAMRTFQDSPFMLTMSRYLKVMNYLMRPLEIWLQPWFTRIERNRRYGEGDDLIRWNQEKVRPSGVAHLSLENGWSYHHIEYRLPSTWLVSPDMAYLYLATAKLSLLAYEHILQNVGDDNLPNYHDDQIDIRKFEEIYQYRLATILAAVRHKLSKDLLDLPRIASRIEKRREAWANPLHGIELEAWAKFIS